MKHTDKFAPLLGLAGLALLAPAARADVYINNSDTGLTNVKLDSPDYMGSPVTTAVTRSSGDTLTVAPGAAVTNPGSLDPFTYTVVDSEGTVNVTGGTISGESGDTNTAVYNTGGTVNTGTVNITGGTISATGGVYNYAVFNDAGGGTVSISGGTFTASGGNYNYDLFAQGSPIDLYGQFYTDLTGTTLYAGPGTLSGDSDGTIYAALANDGGTIQALTYGIDSNGTIVLNDATVSPAPEPSQVGMMALMTLGLGGLLLKARRRTA